MLVARVLKTLGVHPWLYLVAITLFVGTGVSAQCLRTVTVSTSTALNTALTGALPGDCIVLSDGNYSGFTIAKSGTPANPIQIYSANLGGATNNTGIIKFAGVSNVVVSGLTLTTSGGSLTVDGTSRKVAVALTNCANCRVTRCNFKLVGIGGGTAFVMIGGTSYSNRVDHCDFGPNSVGTGTHFIWPVGNATISGVSAPADRTAWAFGYGPINPNIARYTMVDHNYFHDQASGVGEIMVLGAIGDTGDYQDTFTTVEYNLFVNCNGDVEIISSKSSNNTLRYNTVRTSGGVFSLRSGNHGSIYGNFFLCAGTGGGVKLNEHDHRIFNNYIENSDDSNYPIMLESGSLYQGFVNAHAQVMRPQIVHNIVYNAGRETRFAHSGDLPVVDAVFANNILSQSGTIFSESVTPLNATYSSNLAWQGSNPNKTGFTYVNPLLTLVNGLEKLSGSGPAINAANTNFYSYVTDDMDGQTRSVPRDIGADEYYLSGTFIPRSPLTTNEVGPNSVDMELSASPSVQTVGIGATNASYTINLTSDESFANPVTFTVNGLAPGMSSGFNPPTLNGSGVVTLNVTNTSAVPGGIYPLTVTATASNLASGLALTLQVGRSPANLRWTSTNGSAWDIQASSNWFNLGGGAGDVFYNNDTVLLDDTAGVQTNITVGTGVAISPAIFTNNSSVNNFTITGGGKITGATKFVKLGTSTLTLSTSNSFTGGMTIGGGTVRLGNGFASGGQSGFVIVTNGGTFDFNGNNIGMGTIMVSGAGASGTGAVVNNGPAASPAMSYLLLSGNTTIGGTGRWDIRSYGSATADPDTASLSTSSHGYTLTKMGTNTIGIISVTVDPSLGNIGVQGGTLSIEGNTTGLGNSSSTLTVFANAALAFNNTVLTTNQILNKVLMLNDGATVQNTGGNNYFLGPVTLTGNDTFNIGGTALTLSNKLTGAGNLVKTGSGTLTLSGTNVWTGSTTISNGTVAVTASGTISGSQTITIVSGTLSLAGTVTIGNGGIVSGGAGSALSIAGGKLLAANHVVGAGTSPLGTLTMNNATLQLAVVSGLTNAWVNALSLAGSSNTVNVTALPIIPYPVQFPLIHYSSRSGAFNLALGSLPAGYTGKLVDNTTQKRIDLLVTPAVVTPPQFDGASLADTNLVLNGSGGFLNGMFYVLTSTNMTMPLTNWSTVATGFFDGAGNFVFTNGINPMTPSQYFILQTP